MIEWDLESKAAAFLLVFVVVVLAAGHWVAVGILYVFRGKRDEKLRPAITGYVERSFFAIAFAVEPSIGGVGCSRGWV